MTKNDIGNDSKKHEGKKVDPVCADTIKRFSSEGKITCAEAHMAAAELKMPPKKIGTQIDLIGLRITECQLGLFGYEGSGKKLYPAQKIGKELEEALNAHLDQGRISCRECWATAAQLKINRIDMGSACEKKEIRIKPCQLGIF